MPQEVIRIDIQCQVIITHGTSQIILMETRQCTINIITSILRTQMNGLIQVTFGICILSLLQTDNSTCAPSIRIITVHINCRFKIIQSLYSILLLQRHFATHQISTRIPGSYLQQFPQILFGCIIVLFLHMAKRKIMPQNKILRIIFQSCLIIFNSTVIIILPDTGQSTYLIGTYYKRITIDSRIAIRFRTLEIIQIDFCQTAKEVRLI